MALDRAKASGPGRTARRDWVLVASLIGLVVAALGVTVLIDPNGGPNLLAAVYEMLGNSAGAEALRNGQGDQFIAKLAARRDRAARRRRRDLAAVHRRWARWWSGSRRSCATGSCRGSSSPRPLLLLTVYLVYPAVSTVIRSFQDEKGAFTLDNWASLTTGPFLEILRNNVIWLIVGDGGQRRPGPPRRRALRPHPARVAGEGLHLHAARDLARRRDGHLEVRLRVCSRRASRSSGC